MELPKRSISETAICVSPVEKRILAEKSVIIAFQCSKVPVAPLVSLSRALITNPSDTVWLSNSAILSTDACIDPTKLVPTPEIKLPIKIITS